MRSVTVNLPKAFSVRDDHEFTAHAHLVARMHPSLKVKPVAQGIHVNGGPTVFWGIVYHAEEIPNDDAVNEALVEAGFDTSHNGSQLGVHI